MKKSLCLVSAAVTAAFALSGSAAWAVEKTLSTDMLVVGGGGAGLSASIRARMSGLDVTLVEKMGWLGGATAMSSGQMVSQGSKLQKEYGVKDDSPASMIADFKANGHNLNDMVKLNLYAHNVGATVDWLHDKVGVQYKPNDLPFLAEYQHRRVLEPVGGSMGLVQQLVKVAEQEKTHIFLNTRVEKLLTDKSGRVIGATAKDDDGNTYTIKAKAVLLSTGGFGAAKSMLTPELQKTLYYGPVGSTGDGHKMAEAIGAKTELMQYGKRYPNGIEVAPGRAKSTIYANVGAFDQAGILVSVEGKRFVNEKASNRHILDPMLQTPNKQAYVFMDQKSWEGFTKRLPETGVSVEEANQYLQNNGSKAPLFVKGDTIEAAAKAAGINAANLEQTVARYNGFVKAKKDADFGRPVEYMKAEISAQGPYYIVEQKPRFATTMGGLVTNDKLNVLNKAGKPIVGLYAAGEVANGVMGDDSPAGANVAYAMTTGRVAADSIVSFLKSHQ